MADERQAPLRGAVVLTRGEEFVRVATRRLGCSRAQGVEGVSRKARTLRQPGLLRLPLCELHRLFRCRFCGRSAPCLLLRRQLRSLRRRSLRLLLLL